MSRESSI